MKKLLFILFLIAYCSEISVGQEYFIYVTAESEDEVSLIKFDGKEATVEKTIPVGEWPAEIEGPHGITISPDGKYWYLSLAHGNPYGKLYKFETGSDKKVGEATLGLFPASMEESTASGMLFVVNFNLHGDMVPSTLSVVDPKSMTEIKQIPVGIMPHGSRISSDGKWQYSVGMMSGELFETNTLTLETERILNLDTNKPIDPHHYKKKMMMSDEDEMNGMSHMDHGQDHMSHSATKPTWVQPHPDGERAYVAGNGSDYILEIDLEQWKVIDQFKGGKAPYNLDITPDGKKLIVSYKGDGATGIWDLEAKKELARIENTRKVSHGIAISDDGKYAFISVEGIGGEPGTVDVIDLTSLKKVGSANLGKQAGGIAFWKQQ